MYEISAYGHFDAAHFLRGYRGKCANIHGHRWKVEIILQGSELNELGIMIDFMDVKRLLKEVTGRFDHKLINEVLPFDRVNPTAENMAKEIFGLMEEALKDFLGTGVTISRVTVWESEAAAAAYFKK
ncbi:MAG: 6-carboxytetrahydropterin synthase QueD [Firmicutes bacterium HGW-Firmicutes-14]|nr:MAG: 6-carboxytetrahydropterin synthase QueD [Firmicutes bacterium HGW-Firmicutes-14]